MKSHEDLMVWDKAVQLSVNIYHLTKGFPSEEKYGLSSQMRRAAVSVPSNIAEGAARQGAKEFCQFLSIASGSISELDTQLVICQRLGPGNGTTLNQLREMSSDISKMLQGLIRSVKRKAGK